MILFSRMSPIGLIQHRPVWSARTLCFILLSPRYTALSHAMDKIQLNRKNM